MSSHSLGREETGDGWVYQPLLQKRLTRSFLSDFTSRDSLIDLRAKRQKLFEALYCCVGVKASNIRGYPC